jgi:hypothetical protein
MPGTSRAPKRSHAPRKKPPRNAAAALDKVHALALDMELPLEDLADLIHALRLIGYALEPDGNHDGRPIAALAAAATDKLEAVKERWDGDLRGGAGVKKAQCIPHDRPLTF